MAAVDALWSRKLQPSLDRHYTLDYRFLLPVGVAQLIGALVRLIVALLNSIGSHSVGLRVLTVTASFLLYTLTGTAILFTWFTNKLARLKPRATGCLVLCAVSAVFTVFEIHQHLTRAAAEASVQLPPPVNNSSSLASTDVRSQHRIVLLTLLLLQCVIVSFASYLCVKLMWAPASEEPIQQQGSGGEDNTDPNNQTGPSAAAEAGEAAAGDSQAIEMQTTKL